MITTEVNGQVKLNGSGIFLKRVTRLVAKSYYTDDKKFYMCREDQTPDAGTIINPLEWKKLGIGNVSKLIDAWKKSKNYLKSAQPNFYVVDE